MWNVKKLGKMFGLMVAGLFLMSWVMPVNGHAATMTDVTSTSMFKKTYGNALGPGYAVNYPSLDAVTANNTSNGRITTSTTQIAVTFSGTVTPKSTTFNFNSLYFDIMTGNGTSIPGTSVLTSTPANLARSTSTVNLGNSTTQTLNVDLKNLKDDLPLYVGFRFVPSTDSGNSYTYQFAYFSTDATAAAALKPTITGNLTDKDTVIKGTGTNVGDTISSSVNGVTTTVGSDKTYTLDLGTALTGLDKVTVYESNATGDTGSVDGAVTSKSLNIASDKTTADTYPDDLAGLSSDSDVIAWLVKNAGITSTYSDSSSTDGVTYASDTTGLAATLKGLGDGATMSIPVYAKDSSGLKSDPLTITVTNHAGVLKFGTISSDIGFGSLEIPTSETIFQPTSAWNVNVSDTRTAGSNWSVYATATPLTSTTVSTRTLAGNLVYQDGSNKTVLTNASTLIASGTKVAGTTDTAITSDWSTTKGIMLDVKPSVYADSYQGSVDWSLQDTPTN